MKGVNTMAEEVFMVSEALADRQAFIFLGNAKDGTDTQPFRNNPWLMVHIPYNEYVKFLRTFVLPNGYQTNAMRYGGYDDVYIHKIVDTNNSASLGRLMLLDVAILIGIDVSLAMLAGTEAKPSITRYKPTGLGDAIICDKYPTIFTTMSKTPIFKNVSNKEFRYIHPTATVEDKLITILESLGRPVTTHSIRTPYSGSLVYPIGGNVTDAWRTAVYLAVPALENLPIWKSENFY